MLVAIVSAFLGGLILNLMPCVFPVISLKVMGLVRHGDEPGRLRAEGLAFLGGVMAAMLLLAGALIAARAGGAAVGWGFQLQSPLVIAFLALVLLGAGLNLAGLFEVGLSIQQIGQGRTQRGGPMGAALTGVLAIVVATPCSGLHGGGFGLCSGAAASGGSGDLCRAGAGLCGALYLAVLRARSGASPAASRGMDGHGQDGHGLPDVRCCRLADLGSGATGGAGWSGRAAGLLCGAGLCGMDLWPCAKAADDGAEGMGPLHHGGCGGGGDGAGRAAPRWRYSGPSVSAVQVATAQAPVPWSPRRVAELRAQGKPIMVDFSASWCLTCQVNEKTTLSTPEVKAAIADTGTTYMIADSTNFNADIEDAMAAFGRDGLPLYVVYPASGGDPVILPQVLSKATVIKALQDASGQQASGKA
jgi:thiol:disulfide interchange protein DsbD